MAQSKATPAEDLLNNANTQTSDKPFTAERYRIEHNEAQRSKTKMCEAQQAQTRVETRNTENKCARKCEQNQKH